MNEPATGAQQIVSAHQKLKINMSLTEFEQFLDGSVAAPDGERPDDWIALLAPGADEDTRRGLSAALASRAADVKRQVRPPISARLAALRNELGSQGLAGFLVPQGRRASGRICPQAGRAAGLDRQLHRLGRPRHRAQGQGGDLRRRPLHHPGARPGRRRAVRDPAPDQRAAGGLDRRQPQEGRGAGLRSLADHARRRPALPRGRAQGRRRAEGGRPQPAGRRLGRPAAGADRADLAAGDRATPATAPPRSAR